MTCSRKYPTPVAEMGLNHSSAVPGEAWPGSWEGKRNRVRCLKCSDVIESTHQHDFKSCKCGFVQIDGGALGHWRRLWKKGDPKKAWGEMP